MSELKKRSGPLMIGCVHIFFLFCWTYLSSPLDLAQQTAFSLSFLIGCLILFSQVSFNSDFAWMLRAISLSLVGISILFGSRSFFLISMLPFLLCYASTLFKNPWGTGFVVLTLMLSTTFFPWDASAGIIDLGVFRPLWVLAGMSIIYMLSKELERQQLWHVGVFIVLILYPLCMGPHPVWAQVLSIVVLLKTFFFCANSQSHFQAGWAFQAILVLWLFIPSSANAVVPLIWAPMIILGCHPLFSQRIYFFIGSTLSMICLCLAVSFGQSSAVQGAAAWPGLGLSLIFALLWYGLHFARICESDQAPRPALLILIISMALPFFAIFAVTSAKINLAVAVLGPVLMVALSVLSYLICTKVPVEKLRGLHYLPCPFKRMVTRLKIQTPEKSYQKDNRNAAGNTQFLSLLPDAISDFLNSLFLLGANCRVQSKEAKNTVILVFLMASLVLSLAFLFSNGGF